MLFRKRHNDYFQRRSLLLAAILAGTQAWTAGKTFCDDTPANALRIITSPTLVPVITPANEVSSGKPDSKQAGANASAEKTLRLPSKGIFPNQVESTQPFPNGSEPAKRVVPKLLLISDGWNARKSVNSTIPLLDPPPPKPNYALGDDAIVPPLAKGVQPLIEGVKRPSTGGTGVAEPALEQPKSTLNFIMPETRSVPPTATVRKEPEMALAPNTVPAKPVKLSNEQYGPGAPAKLSETKREDSPSCGEELELLSPIDPEEPANEVVHPEQNEPVTSKPSSEDSSNEASSRVGDSLDDEPVMDEAESLDADDSANEPPPMEVRDLKLKSDGSLDAQPAMRLQKAAPVSNRNDAHQSVGDELAGPSPLVTSEASSKDSISPRGDLILAIGMGDSQVRISPTAAKLRVPIERTLNHYWNRPEDTAQRTHWGMFHQMMIFDKDTSIVHRNRKFNAVAWMAGNNPCRNQLLFDQDNRGIIVKEGIGLQGHQAQMLAVFGLIDVPASYPIYVGKNKYTVEDVLRREMLNCKSGNELTFTLIGVSHYVDTDTQWVANDGQDWNFERLIREELAQPIVGAACGGTHRLMGFAHALRRRRAEGKPITGQWERADRYVNDFIDYTWQLQNRDGSMSTEWFVKSEDNGDMDRKIQTTGHMVEFLLSALPPEKLQSPQMVRSMSYLVNTLYQERGHEWPVGPKGHALRALAMYYRTVFGRPDPWRPMSVASRGTADSR